MIKLSFKKAGITLNLDVSEKLLLNEKLRDETKFEEFYTIEFMSILSIHDSENDLSDLIIRK